VGTSLDSATYNSGRFLWIQFRIRRLMGVLANDHSSETADGLDALGRAVLSTSTHPP